MRSLAIITATMVVAAGCGGVGSGDPDGPSVAGGGAPPAPLECGGVAIEDGDVTDLPTLDTLPDEVVAAVDDLGEPVLDTALEWRVAQRSDDQVVLIRELDPQEPAAADGATHATAELGPITGAPNLPDGTWFLWGGSSCSPRVAGTGATQADLRLGDHPSPEDTEVTLLVMERACASGRSAEGRIELQDLELTPDEVRVRIGVRPAGGAQECPGNPWTPFTVDLGEPLGERTVVDANLVPATPLVVGTEEDT
jgi:hypothetical protein